MHIEKSKSSLPRLLLLLTGGTITMVKNSSGVLVPSDGIHEILNTFPLMKEIAEIDPLVVCDIDSSNMSPDIWENLARLIEKNYAQYDGFVITHGTDTLTYTACALSFALGGLNKPVILTGAQKPIFELGSDSPFNLFNSFKVASQRHIREVAIVFDTKIIRGNRSAKKHAKKIDAFWSPQFQLLGEIGVDIRYFLHAKGRRCGGKIKLKASFCPNIVSFNLFPGFPSLVLEKIIEEKWYEGIILRGFGPGNISTTNRLLSLIEKASEQDIPFVLISGCPAGATHLDLYETGKKALLAGAISAQNMTLEATTVKLMWALGQSKDLKKISEIMHLDIAGELGSRPWK